MDKQELSSSTDSASLSANLTKAGIDPAVFDMLGGLLGQEGFFGLIESFLTRTTAYLEAMAEHIANDDYDELHFVAHTLKGSSANLGVMALSKMSAQIDDAAMQHDSMDEIEKMLVQALQQFECSKQALELYNSRQQSADNKVA